MSGGSEVKKKKKKQNPACQCKGFDMDLTRGLGRSPEGNEYQYSCLGNPMDRGVWQAIIHGVSKETGMT